MRRLIWADEARENLISAQAYIQAFNPGAARRFARRIVDLVESLPDSPDRGRPIRPGVRELTGVSPYVIRYAVTTDEIRILSVRHAARRPAP